MLNKLLALLVIAMLIVPATALAKGRPDIAASASKSQSVATEDSSDDADAMQNNDRDENYSSTGNKHGKSASIKAEGAIEDDQANVKREKLNKDEKEALKDARKAEKESLKAQKESMREQRADGDIDSEDESGTVKAKHKNKLWAMDGSETAGNLASAEDSSTGTARGKGIANAMSKIIRNIERMGDDVSNSLKSVVNKFASWLGLSLPFPDAGTSGDMQAGTEDTATAGGTDTTCTAGPGSGITTDTTGSIGSGETSITTSTVISN
ncbi:MAG: hypothetical protein ACYC56_10665 [Candidatus Aquicultor sp.]